MTYVHAESGYKEVQMLKEHMAVVDYDIKHWGTAASIAT